MKEIKWDEETSCITYPPPDGVTCECIRYRTEKWAHKYWYRAFCVSMFFNVLFGMPWIVAIVSYLIERL